MKFHNIPLGACAALALHAAAAHAAAPPDCATPTVFTTALDHLDGYRFFLGPDGDTAVAPLRIDADRVPMLKTGKQLNILHLPTSPKRGVEIVVGPPDVTIGMHPAPYKEMFIMLGGSTDVSTRNFHATMHPGSVLLFDDVGAKTGHGGHTGPCGYISVSIEP